MTVLTALAGGFGLLLVAAMAGLGALGYTLEDTPDTPDDLAAIAGDDALLDALRAGDNPGPEADPLAQHLAAWRDEARP